MRHIILIAACLLSTYMFSQQSVTRITVIGCHNQHDPAPVIPYMAEVLRPHYCIWVGDNVYADTESDPQHIQSQLEVLEAKKGFKDLRKESKFLVTWDDHDYGLNNAGKEYIFKEESKQIHRKFWNLEDEIPADRDGVYYSVIEDQPNGKKIQFIMLDGRYNRDKPGIGADALGENQWLWLEEQLKKKADLRFIASGYQVLLNRPCRWEAWIKLGKSRKRLFELIESTNAKGVVFITGDQHYVEVLRKEDVIGYDAYEIMAAGINKNEKPGWAGKRVAGPDITIHSAPMITVYWDGKDDMPPHLYFTVIDVETNRYSLEYRILFSNIGL